MHKETLGPQRRLHTENAPRAIGMLTPLTSALRRANFVNRHELSMNSFRTLPVGYRSTAPASPFRLSRRVAVIDTRQRDSNLFFVQARKAEESSSCAGAPRTHTS